MSGTTSAPTTTTLISSPTLNPLLFPTAAAPGYEVAQDFDTDLKIIADADLADYNTYVGAVNAGTVTSTLTAAAQANLAVYKADAQALISAATAGVAAFPAAYTTQVLVPAAARDAANGMAGDLTIPPAITQALAESADGLAQAGERLPTAVPTAPADIVAALLATDAALINTNSYLFVAQYAAGSPLSPDPLQVAPPPSLTLPVPLTVLAGNPSSTPTDSSATPPTDTSATPPTDTSATPPTDTAGTPPTDTTDAPPTDTTDAPPTDTTDAPPTDTTDAPPTDTADAPPTDTADAPPTDTADAPPTDTTDTPPTDTTDAPPTDTTDAPPTDTADAPPTDTTDAPPTDTTDAPPTDTAGTPPIPDDGANGLINPNAEPPAEGGGPFAQILQTIEANNPFAGTVSVDDLLTIIGAGYDKIAMFAGGEAIGALGSTLTTGLATAFGAVKIGADASALYDAVRNGQDTTELSRTTIVDIGQTLGQAIALVTTEEAFGGAGAKALANGVAGDLGEIFARGVGALGDAVITPAFQATEGAYGTYSTYAAFRAAGDSPGDAAAATFKSLLHGSF